MAPGGYYERLYALTNVETELDARPSTWLLGDVEISLERTSVNKYVVMNE